MGAGPVFRTAETPGASAGNGVILALCLPEMRESVTSAPNVHAQLRELYRLYRTALMNEKYFGYRLQRVRAINTASEIVLGITASATISSWQFLKAGYGAYVWQIFGGISTLLAVVKPIVRLSKKIELYSKLHVGYCALYFDLKNLVHEVNTQHAFPPRLLKEEGAARDRYKNLELQIDELPNKRLLRLCTAGRKAGSSGERHSRQGSIRSASRARSRQADRLSHLYFHQAPSCGSGVGSFPGFEPVEPWPEPTGRDEPTY
jgi:hypothetical protein